MKNTCQDIVNVDDKGRVQKCGLPAIVVGDIIKCAKHWKRYRAYLAKKAKQARSVS